ncbi:Na+/H+ antiporter NhaD [Desulfurella multipotens]|uniref:Na+/H+ antiporter NhaD n=1 Tax=Desulfurella multipotens TaxID=79269 RepID=A0A1G6R6M8_9BACT|nr:SLC13 family permease [Desulfurella multipotens]SDC99707.1 Na+/H+ antiporter NhaD [Desulfurella multipotens]
MHYIPAFLIICVFALSLVKKIGKFTIHIWQIAIIAAFLCIITNQISLKVAFYSINFDVIFFLFGMFCIGVSIEKSGLAKFFTNYTLKYIKNIDSLLLFIILFCAVSSAFLMNDTIAAIVAPIILTFAKTLQVNVKKLLLVSMLAITIGACASPIGSPQNILIVSHMSANPFLLYSKYLVLPTILNLVLLFLYAKFSFEQKTLYPQNKIVKLNDKNLAVLSIYAIVVLVFLVFLKAFFIEDMPLIYISLIPATIVLLHKKRFTIIKNVDYKTLVFFIGLFILIKAFWNSNILQDYILSSHINLTSTYVIFALTTIASQFVSNVPLVTLYLQVFSSYHLSWQSYLALSVASSIAGNIFLLGAASNIIIAQNLEKHTNQTITSFDFFKYSIIITAINVSVYLAVFAII